MNPNKEHMMKSLSLPAFLVGLGLSCGSAYALDTDLPPLDLAPGTLVAPCATSLSTQCFVSGRVTRYDGLGSHYTPCAQVDVTSPRGVITTYDVVLYQRDNDGDDHGPTKLNTLPQWAYYTSLENVLLHALGVQKTILGLIAPHQSQCDYPDDATHVPVRHLTLQRAQVIY